MQSNPIPNVQPYEPDHGPAYGIIWCCLYLLSIVGVNMGFEHLPIIETKLGPVPAMAFFVGLVFIFRDYAQRYAGHWVLLAMGLGVVLSAAMANPAIAMASAAAFTVGELVDWAVYSATRKPFHQRMIISSACAVPIDSSVFLLGIGVASFGSIAVMSLSKFAVSLVLYSIYKAMEAEDAR